MFQSSRFGNWQFPTHVCKHKKSLYALKKAPWAWYIELTIFLHFVGFRKSQVDLSIFIYNNKNILSYLLIYVDEFILIGNNTSFLDNLVTNLTTRFLMKDLGPLHNFVGV